MPPVLVEDDGHVRYITLNRPERLNAQNSALAWGYVAAIEEAGRDDDAWVVGVTGAGRAFCAGADLAAGRDDPPATPLGPMSHYLDELGWVSRLLLSTRACEKPVVAGINGVAVGGGLAIAMAADIRIMKRSARLIAGYPKVCGSPDGGLSITLPQAMNYEQAMRFLLENRAVDGDEAVRLGLAGESVDDDAFDARFRAYCQSLTRGLSPITARLTKRLVRAATSSVDAEAITRLEVDSIRRSFGSEDGREARRAFLEKREPVFRGR